MLRLKIKSVKHGEMFLDFNDQSEIDNYLLKKGDHFGVVAEGTVEYIIEDVSAEYDRKNARRIDRAARRASIDNIKWNDVNSIAELKQIVKLIVNELNDKY